LKPVPNSAHGFARLRDAEEKYERITLPITTQKSEVHMLHYLWMIIVGIIAGLIARAVMPGNDQMGWLLTGALGITGSFVGGLISRLFSKPADGTMFHPAGFFMSVLGAVVILAAWHFFNLSKYLG
jgi:uncharacterized membrane protein YeaQ/YmgE (transglycosylase-associated protein family)